jgi:hypothetical protein
LAKGFSALIAFHAILSAHHYPSACLSRVPLPHGTLSDEDDDEDCTIDEPVSATLYRDIKSTGDKFAHVFFPNKSHRLLKDWDLWGPLLITMALAIMLRHSAKEGQQQQVFTGVFAITWVGSTVVTINSKLLGCNLSFFQCLCVLGYVDLNLSQRGKWLVLQCVMLHGPVWRFAVAHVE